jgi:hypothetical protein
MDTIITETPIVKDYRKRNEYIKNYQRNRYNTDEKFRLMKLAKVKKYAQQKKERLLFLENQYKEIC